MKKHIYIIILAIAIITSCTEPFDTELDSSYSRLVVQGSISDIRKPHKVILSMSADYFSNAPLPKVSGAVLSITDGVETYSLTEVEDGVYETDSIAGEPGKTYTLSININGELYEAKSLLNSCPPIDSINIGYYDLSDYTDKEIIDTTGKINANLYILINALEPANTENFYLWNIYRNGILESDTLDEVNFSDDILINGNYIYDEPVQWLIMESIKDTVRVGDTLSLEMQSITKEYYDYLNQVMQVTVWDPGPFGGPPANPQGNIKEIIDNDNKNDDPLGFFIAYSTFTISDTIPEKEQWIELEWF